MMTRRRVRAAERVSGIDIGIAVGAVTLTPAAEPIAKYTVDVL